MYAINDTVSYYYAANWKYAFLRYISPERAPKSREDEAPSPGGRSCRFTSSNILQAALSFLDCKHFYVYRVGKKFTVSETFRFLNVFRLV